MLVLIDNFDSFTYNIVHAFQNLGQKVLVLRNHTPLSDIFKRAPRYIVIGPGPGNPEKAGVSKPVILQAQKAKIPLLGICLGHQAIGEVFGGEVKRASRVMHGKSSPIFHKEEGIFRGMAQGFKAARYHSLIVEPSNKLQVTAWTSEKEVMALSHPTDPIFGVQFHPESIASENGLHILQNFLRY